MDHRACGIIMVIVNTFIIIKKVNYLEHKQDGIKMVIKNMNTMRIYTFFISFTSLANNKIVDAKITDVNFFINNPFDIFT